MENRFFGTDGVRGRVGIAPMTDDSMVNLGYAFGQFLQISCRQPSVIIGRDTRVSGQALQSAFSYGLHKAEVSYHSVGVASTPAIAYLTQSQSVDAGVVISASHNPYYDNGVKFFDDKGLKYSTKTESLIQESWQQARIDWNPTQMHAVEDDCSSSLSNYVDFCSAIIEEKQAFKGLRVVLDLAHGAAVDLASQIFASTGAHVTLIHAKPDGTNINCSCGATDLNELQRVVLLEQADCGIAFDGDADRVMMVDHTGAVVDGDQILCILALAAQRSGCLVGGVVGTLMSNLGLEQRLQRADIPFVRTLVGDRYVLGECIKRGWSLGGESSGHIINSQYMSAGDGIITALQILQVMQSSASTLQQLAMQMDKLPQVLLNVRTNGIIQLEHFPELLRFIERANSALGNRGRVLVRPSGTEPCVRIMTEGVCRDTITNTAYELKQQVEVMLGVASVM